MALFHRNPTVVFSLPSRAFSFTATEVRVPQTQRCRATTGTIWIWRQWHRVILYCRRRGWTTPLGIVNRRSVSGTLSRFTVAARIRTMSYRTSAWQWLRARCKYYDYLIKIEWLFNKDPAKHVRLMHIKNVRFLNK